MGSGRQAIRESPVDFLGPYGRVIDIVIDFIDIDNNTDGNVIKTTSTSGTHCQKCCENRYVLRSGTTDQRILFTAIAGDNSSRQYKSISIKSVSKKSRINLFK